MDFTKQSCEDFIEVLAAKEPVPGGGAISMARGNMVGSPMGGKKSMLTCRMTFAH